MKLAHYVTISVFSKPEDDEQELTNAMLNFIPFDLEKEKLKIKGQNTQGFNEKTIKILEINLEKQRHTTAWLNFLKEKLTNEQKELLLKQVESRLDQNLCFFIRLDKEKLLKNKFLITESGHCFHIKISLAAFPAKRESALKLINEILSTSKN